VLGQNTVVSYHQLQRTRGIADNQVAIKVHFLANDFRLLRLRLD